MTEIIGKIRIKRREIGVESRSWSKELDDQTEQASLVGSEDPESVSPLQVVSRAEASTPEASPQQRPAGPSPISWRKISLVAAPIVLGLINLVEANLERETAFKNGKTKYLQLESEGKEAERIAPEQGRSIGQKRKEGIIQEARGFARGAVVGAENAATAERQKGKLLTPVIDMQAEKTMALMRPQHDVMENVLQITRLALMKYEGIIISVPARLSDTKYVGRGRKWADDGELERRIQMMGRLVELAAIAKDREDLSRTRNPFQGCR